MLQEIVEVVEDKTIAYKELQLLWRLGNPNLQEFYSLVIEQWHFTLTMMVQTLWFKQVEGPSGFKTLELCTEVKISWKSSIWTLGLLLICGELPYLQCHLC